jgi:membrane protein
MLRALWWGQMMDRLKRLIRRLDAWTLRHRLPRVTRRAIVGFLQHDALTFAGSMAYFGVLSLFQLLVLGVVVLSYLLGEGAARDFVVEQVVAATPLDAETVTGVIDATIESRGTITIIGFAFLLWSALGIFSALANGISLAFENVPRRPFLQDKLVGLMLMAMAGLLALASFVIGIVTGILQAAASELAADVPGRGAAVWLIGLVVPILLIFVAFWVIYRVVPNRRVGWGEVLPGAVVATLLWTALRFGFTWYATSVARYDSAFGPLATGITFIVFLYFASVIVLLGAEFARARAIDDDVARLEKADPRLLPVPVNQLPAPASSSVRGRVRWVPVAVAAVLGAIAGRLSKRDD